MLLEKQTEAKKKNKLDCNKFRCFEPEKKSITRIKRHFTNWEEVFARHSSEKYLNIYVCIYKAHKT